MEQVDGLENLSRRPRRPVVTVGTFDGVHVGHQRVLSEVVRWSRAESGVAVVVTFEQPPRSVLTGENPPLVTSLPHRLLLLERLGVDLCLVLQFTRELAATSVEDFVRRVLVERLGTRGLVMGHASAFGRGREGGEDRLRQHGRELGFEVRGVAPVLVGGDAVSSTRIRSAVLEGNFDLAARLLGRQFSLFGTVVRGAGRGRELGFPTANLDLHHEVIPPDGVYLATGRIGEETRPAVVSVGTRATFAHPHDGERTERVVEVHLLDFDGQIYGCDVETGFLSRIRSQKQFADVDELVGQMQDDVRCAREYFAGR